MGEYGVPWDGGNSGNHHGMLWRVGRRVDSVFLDIV